MSQSPIRALIAQTLRPIERRAGMIDSSELYLALFHEAGTIGAEAVAGSGVGLDHFAGERVLAAVLLRDTPKGNEHRLACAITDRRTALSGWSSISGPMTFNAKRGSIAHAELTGVDVKDGMLACKVTLEAPSSTHELPFGAAVKPLGAFFRSLGQIPAAQRVEPSTLFVQANENDPAGARGVAERLWFDDAEAHRMLGRVVELTDTGEMDPGTGQDFTGRVLLAHRTRMGGPGMREGRWLSPLSAQDLGHTLVGIFGNPASHTRPQPGVEMLDFRIDPRRDYLGAAMKALGVASFVGIGFGLSPGKAIARALMKRREVRNLRVLFADLPGCAGYKLSGEGVPLEQIDSRMAQRIHAGLNAAAYAVLGRRTELGWSARYDQLWG